MKKVIVIGGGASGLISAIYSSLNNNEVIILERNNKCGKKLLMTGNGRCNYWNQNQDIKHYHSTENILLKNIINGQNQKEILNFFNRIGIIPKIKDGWYYPYSNQAISINYALIKEAKLSKVKIITDTFVKEIKKEKNKFKIITDKKNYECDYVILATGSKAMPITGSDGNGYNLIKSFNHSIIKPLPALTALKSDQLYMKDWSGIRTEVKIKYEDKIEKGEIQLTNYGISGICVFNLSYKIAKEIEQNKKVFVTIDFLPWLKLNNEEFKKWIIERNKILKNRNILELFDGILNYKLVLFLLKINKIDKDKKWLDLTIKEQEKIINSLKNFKLNIIGTNNFDNCQVCSGGVSLKEINLSTMESLKIKNLYIIGELLDVNGDCGGYNLSFAWISGMLAGKSIK